MNQLQALELSSLFNIIGIVHITVLYIVGCGGASQLGGSPPGIPLRVKGS